MPSVLIGVVSTYHLAFQRCQNILVLTQFNTETDIIKDLSNKEGADPWEAFVGASPRVSIDTIVEGVLTLIEDETRNGKRELQYVVFL